MLSEGIAAGAVDKTTVNFIFSRGLTTVYPSTGMNLSTAAVSLSCTNAGTGNAAVTLEIRDNGAPVTSIVMTVPPGGFSGGVTYFFP